MDELRYSLGEWNHSTEEDSISELVAVVMILCNRIGELEHLLKTHLTEERDA